MKFEYTEVMNFKGAFRGMRNPKNSWKLSDSDFSDDCHSEDQNCNTCKYFDGFGKPCIPYIGPKDMALAQALIRAGSEHRKFMRQIIVSVDITASLYWWKEFDTYKVGTVANSTSTMHKIDSKPITVDCFETDDYDMLVRLEDETPLGDCVDGLITWLEELRKLYKKTGDKRYWKELIRWLPEGWLQTRTITMSYENLLAMCSKGQRRFHKLTEWSQAFVSWARTLPYAQELIFIDELDDAKRELDQMAATDKFRSEIKKACEQYADDQEYLFDEFERILSGYKIQEAA